MLAVLLVLLSAVLLGANAADIYAAADGVTSGGCASQGARCTWARAISLVASGDTLWVTSDFGVMTIAYSVPAITLTIRSYVSGTYAILEPSATQIVSIDAAADLTLIDIHLRSATASAIGLRQAGAALALVDCKLTGNTGGKGGAIYVSAGALTVTDSIFDSNVATERGMDSEGEKGCVPLDNANRALARVPHASRFPRSQVAQSTRRLPVRR